MTAPVKIRTHWPGPTRTDAGFPANDSPTRASVVSFFVGGEEVQLRRDLERDIVKLREEIARLVASEEVQFRADLHRDVNQLRQQIAHLVHAEELQFRKQFQHEIAQLRADVAALRAELALRDARNMPAPPPAEHPVAV